MSLELGLGVTFSVEFVLEVEKELLECIQGCSDCDVGNENRSLKDSFEAGLVTDFNDSFVDSFGNLRTHSLRYFGPFLPEDINGLLLSLASIGTHV